jgi:DNA-binding SARP family transcriptional activator
LSIVEEISALLTVIDRDIEDAGAENISEDNRLSIIYNAILQLATIALGAKGYRASRAMKHYRTIQSLEHTIGLDSKTIDQIDKCRKKRNISDYEMAGSVSGQEVEEMLELAQSLRARVLEWLRGNHPGLVPE